LEEGPEAPVLDATSTTIATELLELCAVPASAEETVAEAANTRLALERLVAACMAVGQRHRVIVYSKDLARLFRDVAERYRCAACFGSTFFGVYEELAWVLGLRQQYEDSVALIDRLLFMLPSFAYLGTHSGTEERLQDLKKMMSRHYIVGYDRDASA
jgi:hypothetical protein